MCPILMGNAIILFESSAKVLVIWQERLRLEEQTNNMGLSSTVKNSVGEALFKMRGPFQMPYL